MSLYLDTEFNGFGGELISLALYDSDTGKHFYEVLNWYKKHPLTIQPWVRENVIPVLNKESITSERFRVLLLEYLNSNSHRLIYADWAEDFIHLLKFLYGENGIKYIKYLDMRLITTQDTILSKIPHNALSDAEALSHNYMG